MRITIATGPWLPAPALQGGAIPRMWQGLAEEFARKGHAVCIFARAYPGQPAEERIKGVEYRRWGGFQQSLSIKADLIKDFVYSAFGVGRLPQGDILITNVFWLPFLAGYFRRRAGKIVVNANRFPKGQYRLYSRAARIAAASTSIRDAIAAQTPRMADRTRVFPNPIDIDLLTPPVQNRIESKEKTVLFVGRLHPEKGVHLLIEAFRRISDRQPNWRLRLVGPIAEHQGGGGSAYENHLLALAENLPVEFTGPVFDHSKLADVYRNGHIFCYPSLAEKGEALPVAPLEAMATGLVPIVSKIDCFHDFIYEDESGFYFNQRVADPAHELALQLERAMGDVTGLQVMGERSTKIARKFGYASIAEAYIRDFEGLLGERRSE